MPVDRLLVDDDDDACDRRDHVGHVKEFLSARVETVPPPAGFRGIEECRFWCGGALRRAISCKLQVAEQKE